MTQRLLPPVTFVLIDPEPLGHLSALQPDRDWGEFVTGERAWILQTYLQLKARGCAVSLSHELPADGIAVFSAKQRILLRRQQRHATSALLVGVRQDLGEALIADVEVVQNPFQADDATRFFIPHWPQPGLIPRDEARGDRIECIAFKGFAGNLHPDFFGEAWQQFLTTHHLRWSCDAALYRRGQTRQAVARWNDFHDADLLLAVRPYDGALHPRKPATKLYNAWLAGVPALLGPESAYRQLRRSELDYIEVDSLSSACAAVTALLQDRDRYRAMIQRGHERAAAFTPDEVARRWQELLFDVLPELRDSNRVRRWQGRSLLLKDGVRRVARALALNRRR
jgi:hypothetical protein